VTFIKAHKDLTAFIVLSIFILSASLFQQQNLDTYLHYSMGKVIAEQGIVHYDPFGHHGGSPDTREYIPSEWLFQVIIYQFLAVFGMGSYTVFIGLFAILQVGMIYLLLRRIAQAPVIASAVLAGSFFVINYGFFVARPYLLSYTLLYISLYLVLLYIYKNINYLYLLLPIGYIWTSLHPSIYLGMYFTGFYAFLLFIYYTGEKDRKILKKSGVLLLTTLGLVVASILPPNGFNAHKFSWMMLQNADIVRASVAEWMPLSSDKFTLTLYNISVGIGVLIMLVGFAKKRRESAFMWLIPILFLPILGYFNIRNTYFGYLAIILIAGWTLAQIQKEESNRSKLSWIIPGILLIISSFQAYRIISQYTINSYFPTKIVSFLQQNKLQGNMFNQFGYGGYLETHLYPDYKVFMDGRLDSYLCCEMRDFYDLQLTRGSAPILGPNLFKLFDKYNISYAVLVTANNPQGRVFSESLQANPQWSQAFQDNNEEIWIRNDGKNPEVYTNSTKYLTYQTGGPKQSKIYSNKDLQLQFSYPETLQVGMSDKDLISLTPQKALSPDDLLLIYVTTLKNDDEQIQLPFDSGQTKGSINIPHTSFNAKILTVTTATGDGQLFLLKKEKKVVVVRPPRNNLIDPQTILDIVQSIQSI
jgi:hypothetical protein